MICLCLSAWRFGLCVPFCVSIHGQLNDLFVFQCMESSMMCAILCLSTWGIQWCVSFCVSVHG